MSKSLPQTLTRGISIIICSYNGSKKIKKTLEHIAAQIIRNDCPTELIYVDNASSDNSLAIVEETWAQIGPAYMPLITLQETKAGKYFALAKGLRHASYTYFIICDDDNWLAPNYIDKVYTILKGDDNIGAVGGQSIAVFDQPDVTPPFWFTENQQCYAIGTQGDKTGDVSKRKQLWGAGMASRTEVYLIFYKEYPSVFLNMNKNIGHFVAEDSEFCLRLLLRGYKLFYDEELVLEHYIPIERLELPYYTKLKKRIEDSLDIIECYNIATKLYGSISYNTFGIMRLKLSFPFRFLFAKKPAAKRKVSVLANLLFPSMTKENPVIKEIQKFATTADIPFCP